MSVEKCKECEFFGSSNPDRAQSFGDCVYKPPVVQPNGESVFPRVFSEMRCGKGIKKGVA